MNDIVYVYVDHRKVIHEIEMEPNGKFIDFDLILIPYELAEDIIALKEKWIRNANSKRDFVILKQTPSGFFTAKTIYIYYNIDDKSIKAISRKQESLDNDKTLLSGLIEVDDLVMEIVTGKKNTLNFVVNDNDGYIFLQEKEKEKSHYAILDGVLLIEDYKIDSFITEDTSIEIRYNNEKIIVKKIKDIEETDIIYHLFFVNPYDKTLLYENISFSFKNEEELIIPLSINDEFFIMSQFKKYMAFIKESGDE
jgi:hypothetical protein